MRDTLRSAIIGFVSGTIAALLVVTVFGRFESGWQDSPIPEAQGQELPGEQPASLEGRTAEEAPVSQSLPVDETPQTPAGETPAPDGPGETSAASTDPRERFYERMRDRNRKTTEKLRDLGWTDAEIAALERLRVEAGLEMEERMFHEMRRRLEENPATAAFMRGSSPFRDELSEEKYEQYLRARGETRLAVPVHIVIEGSTAEMAGLQTGDAIRRVGNERVYNEQELTFAMLQGEYGESVVIEVERDGSIFYLTVPRGPMGTSRIATMMFQ